MEIDKKLTDTDIQLEKEREMLDKLAEESLRCGKSLSSDEKVMRQMRIVNDLVLKEVELQKMLDEYKEEPNE